MLNYIIRRLLYFIPILVGVNAIVFVLFFFTNTPDDMAAKVLGKNVTPDAIDTYKRNNNLDLPYFINNGWRRIGALSARELKNSRTFRIDGAGEYRITVEAPSNYASFKAADKRKVSVQANALSLVSSELDNGSVTIQPDFGITTLFDQVVDDHTITKTPEEELKRSYRFALVENNEGAINKAEVEKTITIKFDLGTKGLRHRVTLDGRDEIGLTERFTKTLFWQYSLRKLWFNFGRSMRDRPIGRDIRRRILPSLCITVPSMVMGLIITLFFAMMLAYLRGTKIDFWGVIYCILLMSISGMFYIIGGQYVLGKSLSLFPISGFDYGVSTVKFVMIPITIALVGGLGGGIRFYRTIFLEEINKDYVRTARAKGLNERATLFIHVLKNAMIPILTNVVVGLPFLIMGSLVTESFFAIPGLGGYMLEGIQAQDFFIVQSMVSLSSFLLVIALLMADISYTLVDPRVRLE